MNSHLREKLYRRISLLSDLCVNLFVLSVKYDFNAENAEEDAEIAERKA